MLDLLKRQQSVTKFCDNASKRRVVFASWTYHIVQPSLSRCCCQVAAAAYVEVSSPRSPVVAGDRGRDYLTYVCKGCFEDTPSVLALLHGCWLA